MDATPPALAQAREQFLAMVESLRPELHRYCARLTGSVIEGEDIVQEALARGFYALSLCPDVPPLRPWLFRIAHNAAVDFLRSHGQRITEVRGDFDDVEASDDRPDPSVVRAALAHFVALPLTQRNAVILKDVLGHSLEETAETMGTTVMAVKAALVRGRAALRSVGTGDVPKLEAQVARDLDCYATLFNARDWDGVRSLIGDTCRLDLVAKSQRRGKQVGMYFTNYEKADVSLRVMRVEGRLALAAHVGGAETAAYVILLDWVDGKVSQIRDYRYVPYILAEAEVEPA